MCTAYNPCCNMNGLLITAAVKATSKCNKIGGPSGSKSRIAEQNQKSALNKYPDNLDSIH